MRSTLSHLLRRATTSSTATHARNFGSKRSIKNGDDDGSVAAAAASFDSALKSLLLVLHPDAVHGHPHAERANAEAFKELKQWSDEIGKGNNGSSSGGPSRRRRRLRFFVRTDNAAAAVAPVSATLPPPSAARLSDDPSKLLRPVMIAAGLAEGGDEEYNEEDDSSFDEERRRRSYQASTSQVDDSAHDDVDDVKLAALRGAEFFAAAARASAARRARANNPCPLLLDAARRRAAMRIVHGVTVRYGRGFSPNSPPSPLDSSPSDASSPLSPPPPSPSQVLAAVQRLAAVVEELSGEGSDGTLRGSTVFLVRRERRRKGKSSSSKRRRRRSRSSGVDAATGAVSLDVGDGDGAWRDALSEASDPLSGSAVLRTAAERREGLQEVAARALGVESVSLLLGQEEEEEDDDDDGDDDDDESKVRETISLYDALVQQLASAPLPRGDSTQQQQRRHAGVNVVVVGEGAETATTAATANTIFVRADASPLDVFSAVESLGPAASARYLETRKAERAARRLLDAAAAKLGARALAVAGGLGTPEAAALAARILRAPASSSSSSSSSAGIDGIARKFPAKVEFFLGKRNAVSADGLRVTLGSDFEV